VKIGILRAGAEPFEVTVVRERVLPSSPQGRMLAGDVGYVKITDFTPATADEVRTQVDALKRGGAARLVLDLRDAAWGQPPDGAKVAELFLAGGPVAKIVGRRAEEKLLQADAAKTAWSGPLAVLVDNGTAGPAEVVAGALLDAGRAKLVGERTFGRAGVSRPVPLPEGGLVLTVAKFMSPKGASIHGEGLQPTVAVERERDDEDRPEGAEAPDRILERALEVVREDAKEKAAA
jgi:carboxyl-terminal processing protease